MNRSSHRSSNEGAGWPAVPTRHRVLGDGLVAMSPALAMVPRRFFGFIPEVVREFHATVTPRAVETADLLADPSPRQRLVELPALVHLETRRVRDDVRA